MADLLDQRIRELERLHRRQRCFNKLIPMLIASLFCASLIVMFLRLSVADSGWLELPIIIAALLIQLIKLPKVWQQQYNKTELAAELDLLCEGRGLCMALSENESTQRDSDWLARLRKKLEDIQFPRFNWHAAKWLPLVLCCVIAAFCMPSVQAINDFQQRFAPFFDDLITELDELAENEIIEEEFKEQKKEQLEQLKEKASEQGMSQELWLARDAIKNYINQQKHTAGQRLAEAIVASENLKDKQDAQRQEQLMQALANLAEQNKDMLKQLNPEQLKKMAQLAQAMGQQMKLTPEQLEAMKKHFQKHGLNAQQMQMGKNGDMPQLSKEQQQQLAKKLLEQLNNESKKMCQMGCNVNEFLVRFRNNGGIARGPGHVQLHEQDPTNIDTGKHEALMPGIRVNNDGSITLAETVREADISEAAMQEAVRAAAKEFNPAAADSRQSVTAPRHRYAIANYFKNNKQQVNQNEPEEIDIP